MDAALLNVWNGSPSLVGGIAALGGASAFAAVHELRNHGGGVAWGHLAAVGAGLLVLTLALVSPLDALADRALFSAHMLQHLLLTLVVPPLFLLGLPVPLLARAGRAVAGWPPLGWVGHPLVLLAGSLGALWVWHAPRLYDAALHDTELHAVEHLCFLVTAGLYWWPVVRPGAFPRRLPDPLQLAYLFAGAAGSSLLGILITFSPGLLYATYASNAGLVSFRASLGLSPLEDQQLGGLLMWMGGGLWYLGAVVLVFARWVGEEGSQ